MTTGEARRPGLLIPEPAWRPGDHADFSDEALPGPGETRRPEIDEAPEEIRDLATGLVRVLDDEGRGGGALGPRARAFDADRRPAPHVARPRVRPEDAHCTTAGQGVVLHAGARRGGGGLRISRRSAHGRHELPDVPPARAADRGGLSDRADDGAGVLERARPAPRSADARDVLGARVRLLLHLGQPRHAVRAGSGVGDGRRDQGR